MKHTTDRKLLYQTFCGLVYPPKTYVQVLVIEITNKIGSLAK